MFNIGINVNEVDGRATPSITGAPTSITGFVIRAQRGVPGTVRRVTNWRQFNEFFGGYLSDAFGAYALRGFLDNGGTVAQITRIVDTGVGGASSASVTLAGGGGDSLVLNASYRGQDDPGTWGNALSVQVTVNANDANLYDLAIRQGETTVETFVGLANTTVVDTLNDEFAGSKYVRVVGDPAVDNPDPTEDTGSPIFVALTGGTDDSMDATALNNAIIAAFPLFDNSIIQLLTCPESESADIVTAGEVYCANRGDCMYIGHTPQNTGAADIRSGFSGALQQSKAFAALYFPWILINDPIGSRKWIPPVGHVAGVYARTDRERGVEKAPAGVGATVRGALDVRFNISPVDHTDLVKNASVNAIRFVPGSGIIIDSARTLSTSPLWYYVNVRLLFNFVKSSLTNSLNWVVYEPNDPALWNRVKFNTIVPFLTGLYNRGAFGPGAIADVFDVKIDAENNPPANIQQGILTIEVYFYPSRPAETIIITIGQQDGGGSASES